MTTKGQIVSETYEELRISGLTSSPSSSEIESAIIRMDRMVLSWEQYNICLGYNPIDPDEGADPAQDSGLSQREVLAVILNLSVSMSSSFGKPPTMQTKADAKTAYDGLFSTDMAQREASPYQPMGAGSRARYNYGGSNICRRDFQEYKRNAPQDCDTLDIKVGQTKIYIIDLGGSIDDGDEIASYEYVTEGGISVESISESEGLFTVEISADQVMASSLKITMLFDPSTQVNPVTTYFNVTNS